MKPVVLGAAGFLGVNLVDALRDAGIEPLCGRRRRENVLPLRKRKVPMCIVELDEVDVLTEAMEGCDTVFHAAAHYPRYSHDYDEVIQLGVQQTQNALDGAVRAKVSRFVFVSTTATVAPAPEGASTEQHLFAQPPGYGLYHDLKWEMEQLVLTEDRLQTLVGCPAGCLGPWDLRVATSALIVAMARHVDPPHPDGIVNLVDVRDVGKGLVRMAQLDDPPKRVIFCGSSHQLHPLMEQLAYRYNAPQPSAPLTIAAAIALADAEEAKCAKEGGRAAISREIVDLIINSRVIDSSLAERSLGMEWTPLKDTLHAFDEFARRLRIIPPLDPG
ncbi:MAG: NAD-dependent epimerase/dehydratase family protein [Proteobacteria bacterium]|nr:NAD-dependent epimerase/dehydratase family protein [Pseudomonadota bacterium]